MATAAAMCRSHASEARRPEAGSRAVGVRDVEGWRMPVPSGMSEQRTWSSAVREAETQDSSWLIIYLYVSATEEIFYLRALKDKRGNGLV